jgi:hypothetical protein
MAEAATETGMRSQRTKLTLKDLGEGAMVKAMTAEQLKASGNKCIIGYLVGRARGFVDRTDEKTAEKFEGLLGAFRMVPSDTSREQLESGVLFIPDAFHNLVGDRLREVRKTDENATVEFAFEVSSIPAKNPAGYSWNFQPAMEFTGKNPLDELAAKALQIVAARQKQLAGPAARK